LDTKLLVVREKVPRSKSFQALVELYYYFKGLRRKVIEKESRERVVAYSWKNQVFLDKKELKNLIARVKEHQKKLQILINNKELQ